MNPFHGPTAHEAKRLASQIAMAFSHKMGLCEETKVKTKHRISVTLGEVLIDRRKVMRIKS